MTITVEDHATPGLRSMMARLADRTALHAEMGMAVERQVARHMRGSVALKPNRLGAPSTGFWQKAINSIRGTATDSEATVSIPARGVALQYYGGTVRPTSKEYLTIPIHAMAHGKSAREIGVRLYRFMSKKGNLILATDPNPRRGSTGKPSKKRARLGGYRGGTPLYVLKRSARILPHPNVLPDAAALGAEAAKAAGAYIGRLNL
jgi:hypothetical protein